MSGRECWPLTVRLGEAETVIAHWGATALNLWRALVPTLTQPVHMTCAGTLVVAHRQDRAGIQHLAERVTQAGFGAQQRWLQRDELRELEPETGQPLWRSALPGPRR